MFGRNSRLWAWRAATLAQSVVCFACTGPADPAPTSTQTSTWTWSPSDCLDRDGDGYADASCGGSDCDDTRAEVGPKKPENPCNGIDDDCNPNTIDDRDLDDDSVSECNGDCDDDDPSVHPGSPEVSCNGIDDDCDPSTVDDDGIDADNDGFGTCDDCNDNSPQISPNIQETCDDGVDNDCDGIDNPCPGCGNGVLEPGEVCDDGNTIGGDGCRPDCLGLEICGDGLADLDAGEHCDGAQDGACSGSCDRCLCPSSPGPWRFIESAQAAGLIAQHVDDIGQTVSGGVAVGDYDDDGWIDVYTVGGSAGTNRLFRNQGDGTFIETTSSAGVAVSGETSCGPTFADLNGDGAEDLLIGGQAKTPIRIFRNQLDGTFVDATAATGITNSESVIGAALADVNGDSFLDIAVARWTSSAGADHLFYSTGDGGFVGAGPAGGLSALNNAFNVVYTFTPNFADINGDGILDFLVSSDFGTSRYFFGNGDGTFVDATTPVITDESGMGASIGDYDNDGDLDWFISSIWDPNGVAESPWGVTGNRLYKNLGDGTFADATDEAGVRVGYWGWGACFADFNLDGHLDIFHVNGFEHLKAFEFDEDPSVLFLNNQDGTFTQRASELGLFDISQGRGVSCFDYDRDGDVDILIATYQGPVLLFANNGAGLGHFLRISLNGPVPNTRGIGALVRVTSGGVTQSRPIRAGSNYASQDPPHAHFGLGQQTEASAVEIVWPDGSVQSLGVTAGDQFLTVSPP